MKTLKGIFENKTSNKSINTFTETLDIKSMLLIKGGDGDDDDKDSWPPASDPSNTNN